MNLNVDRHVELGRPFDCLEQNFLLDGKLTFITGMLVMTTTAPAEIGADGLDPVGRWLEHRFGACPGKTRLLLGECGLDFLARQNEGNKDCLAAALLIGGQTCQSVAAINQLFHGEEQDSILNDYSERSPGSGTGSPGPLEVESAEMA